MTSKGITMYFSLFSFFSSCPFLLFKTPQLFPRWLTTTRVQPFNFSQIIPSEDCGLTLKAELTKHPTIVLSIYRFGNHFV